MSTKTLSCPEVTVLWQSSLISGSYTLSVPSSLKTLPVNFRWEKISCVCVYVYVMCVCACGFILYVYAVFSSVNKLSAGTVNYPGLLLLIDKT